MHKGSQIFRGNSKKHAWSVHTSQDRRASCICDGCKAATRGPQRCIAFAQQQSHGIDQCSTPRIVKLVPSSVCNPEPEQTAAGSMIEFSISLCSPTTCATLQETPNTRHSFLGSQESTPVTATLGDKAGWHAMAITDSQPWL